MTAFNNVINRELKNKSLGLSIHAIDIIEQIDVREYTASTKSDEIMIPANLLNSRLLAAMLFGMHVFGSYHLVPIDTEYFLMKINENKPFALLVINDKDTLKNNYTTYMNILYDTPVILNKPNLQLKMDWFIMVNDALILTFVTPYPSKVNTNTHLNENYIKKIKTNQTDTLYKCNLSDINNLHSFPESSLNAEIKQLMAVNIGIIINELDKHKTHKIPKEYTNVINDYVFQKYIENLNPQPNAKAQPKNAKNGNNRKTKKGNNGAENKNSKPHSKEEKRKNNKGAENKESKPLKTSLKSHTKKENGKNNKGAENKNSKPLKPPVIPEWERRLNAILNKVESLDE